MKEPISGEWKRKIRENHPQLTPNEIEALIDFIEETVAEAREEGRNEVVEAIRKSGRPNYATVVAIEKFESARNSTEICVS